MVPATSAAPPDAAAASRSSCVSPLLKKKSSIQMRSGVSAGGMLAAVAPARAPSSRSSSRTDICKVGGWASGVWRRLAAAAVAVPGGRFVTKRPCGIDLLLPSYSPVQQRRRALSHSSARARSNLCAPCRPACAARMQCLGGRRLVNPLGAPINAPMQLCVLPARAPPSSISISREQPHINIHHLLVTAK